MSRRPSAIHWAFNPGRTQCGLWIEDLETKVSSGSREWVLRTSETVDGVTCCRCKRSLRKESKK